MKNILLIGVGGTGSNTVDILYSQIRKLGLQNDNSIKAIVFDTDKGDIAQIEAAVPISMADNASVGTVCDRVGKQYIREWFPCDDKSVRTQELIRGASQWRKKSYLAFLNVMNKPRERTALLSTLETMTVDPNAACEVYVITSLAGGTGSGSFIPIALYVKRYLRKQLGKNPMVSALVCLPDIYAQKQTPENKIKVYSNAYAILREINAINLVSRNYNEGRTGRKKAPIRFRIGNPNEPNVGVLFDASDKAFWTPEAAPFNQIFVLDKIPGVNSVEAHNIVLADSLYSLICTDIGKEFDSEASNHEIVRSQSNGSNAIFASISSAQMRFPTDSVLEYLAYSKTLEACEAEWLLLHREVEKRIAEKDKQEKELGRRLQFKDGDYAKIVLETYADLEAAGKANLVDLIDEATAVFDKDGKKTPDTTADLYVKSIMGTIKDRLGNAFEFDKGENDVENAKDVGSLLSNADIYFKNLQKLFVECVDTINRTKTSFSESIISLDKLKDDGSKKAYTDLLAETFSLVQKALMHNKKYIHPVAAMVQLCRIRTKLMMEDTIQNETEEWPEFKQRKVSNLPERYYAEITEEPRLLDNEEAKDTASYYTKLGNTRFSDLREADEDDLKKKIKNAKYDNAYLRGDAERIGSKIISEAEDQLRHFVLRKVFADIDLLIDKYRTFFGRFDKEKEDLVEETKTARKRDAKPNDSILNIYSSEEDKEKIKNKIFKDAGPETTEEREKNNDIVGKGVFLSVYNSACAEKSNDQSFNDKDASSYRSLFKNMVDSYRSFIKNSEAFKAVASYNVIEAIEATCTDPNNVEERDKLLKYYFANALEIAKPPIAINNSGDLNEVVQASDIEVFLVSYDTGKYIKKNAEKYGIKVSVEKGSEAKIVRSCVIEFIQKYASSDSARVAVVDKMASNVIYCTGEKIDISPLRVPKFNELGEDAIYYKEYRKAIHNYKVYDTDMWNPHLGYNLEKRGYLPYMNPEMESIYDVKMVKALFYGFLKRGIRFSAGSTATTRGIQSFSYTDLEGRSKKIRAEDGTYVSQKNIALLLSWIRNEDELIEDWAERFDNLIQEEKNKLPSVASEKDLQKLEQQLTTTSFMTALRNNLFEMPDYDKDRKDQGVNGPSIIEFAYLVKTSEESIRDNDDAERLLTVAYDTFKDLVAFRVNPEMEADKYEQVYRQQLEDKFFVALANSKTVRQVGLDYNSRASFFNQLSSWLFSAETFMAIPKSNPVDEQGNMRYTEQFKYESIKPADLDKEASSQPAEVAVEKKEANEQ